MNTDLNENAAQTSESVRRLGNAADRVSGIFGGLFTGAPKTIHGVTSALNGLVPGIGVANKALSGFEGYVGVLQSLSQQGLHFNNNLEEMILQAGAANMQIGDLARMASEAGEELAQLGAGANAGLQSFLLAQKQFYAASTSNFDNTVNNALEQRLKRLGLTVDDINDRFLRYDMIQAVSNVTDRNITAERNKRATEFAEEMDRLAKLTGKQADQLAKAVEQTAREGRVFAATQLLPESVRTQFASDITGMAESYGPAMANFMKDMVTQGFPTPGDPAMEAINSYAPELAGTFETYNNLMKQGKADEAQVYLDSARQQIERLRTDRNFLEMVRVSASGASEHARAMGEISTQLNNSVAVSRSAIIASLRANGETGEITDEMIQAERDRLRQQQRDQQRDADPGSAQAVYQGYLDNLTNLQKIAMETQRQTVTRTFDLFADGVQKLADSIARLDITAMIRDGSIDIDNYINEMFPNASGTGNDSARINTLIDSMTKLTGEFTAGSIEANTLGELATELGAIQTAVGSGTATDEQKTRLNEIRGQMDAIMSTLISTNPDHGLPPEVIEAIRNSSFNQGTMGAGKLFRDFGNETFAALHGLEAVTTPDQMADIVRASSGGTMQALVDQFTTGTLQGTSAQLAPMLDTFARNNVTTLNGMLNTVRREVSTSGSNNQAVDIDLSTLETAIMNLPAKFKQPVEEALNSVLKPAMDQVAANTARGAEYGERTFRNTRGISQDYMRGA